MMQKMHEGGENSAFFGGFSGEIDQDMQIQYIQKAKMLHLISEDTADFYEQIFLFQNNNDASNNDETGASLQQINYIDNQK